MRTVKLLEEQMSEEVHGSLDYAESALEYKFQDPDLGKYYHNLSQIEYEHAEKLNELYQKKIKDFHSALREIPVDLEDKWDKKNKEFIKELRKAKTCIDMF